MVHVLFICHGNICRSPMAEFLFRDLLQKRGLCSLYSVSSAATSREEIGNPVYPAAKKKLTSLGIDCMGKRARQVTKEDYTTYDYLLVMENYNTKNLLKIIGDDPQKKVFRLLDFSALPRDIADPWYTGDFNTTHKDIMEGLEGFLSHISSEK